MQNIKEALKKIEQFAQRRTELKECWFALIQKSINAAARYMKDRGELEKLSEMSNKYIRKEVIERYFKVQV